MPVTDGLASVEGFGTAFCDGFAAALMSGVLELWVAEVDAGGTGAVFFGCASIGERDWVAGASTSFGGALVTAAGRLFFDPGSATWTGSAGTAAGNAAVCWGIACPGSAESSSPSESVADVLAVAVLGAALSVAACEFPAAHELSTTEEEPGPPAEGAFPVIFPDVPDSSVLASIALTKLGFWTGAAGIEIKEATGRTLLWCSLFGRFGFGFAADCEEEAALSFCE